MNLISEAQHSGTSGGRALAWITTPTVLAMLVALGGLGLYLLQLHAAEMNGDAALYAAHVARSDLSELTLHAGFLAAGVALDRLLPGPATLALNLLSAVAGALGAGLTTWLTWRLIRSRAAGVVAGLALLLAGNYWTHALYGEVYVVQTFLVILTWVCWVEGRTLWAGLAFLAAMLISPLTVLTLPGLLLAAKVRKRPISLSSLVLFGLVWVPAYVCFVWLNRYEYLSRHTFVAGSWRYDLPYSLAFLGFSFLTVWPPTAWGLLTAGHAGEPRRGNRTLLLAAGLTLAAHILVVGRMSDHGAFFLPLYPLVAIIAGAGAQGWWSWERYSPAVRRRLVGVTVGLALLAAVGVAAALAFPLFAQHARRYLGEFDTSLVWLYPATALAVVTAWIAARRLGVAHLQATIGALLGLLLAWQGVTSQALMVSPQVYQARRIQQLSAELEAYRQPNSLIIATWSQGALYEYYTTGQVARHGWWEIKQEVTEDRLQAALQQYDQVWLVHPYGPELLRESGLDPDRYDLETVSLPAGTVWLIRGK